MDHSGGGGQGAGGSVPYLGSKISLISSIDIRYEGTLYSINATEATVALKDVRSFGTEGRRSPEVPPSNKTYQFIIFKGSDIQDLTVSEPAPPPQIRNDPAVVSVNVPPARGGGMGGNRGGGGDWMSAGQDEMSGWAGGGGGHHPGRMHGGGGGRGGHMGGGGGGMMRAPQHHYGGYGGGFGDRGGRGPPGGPDMYGVVRSDVQYGRGGGRGGHPGGRGGGPRPGGGGGRGGGGGGGGVRRVVGELPPQPNQQVKKELATAFDFDASNAKLNKAEIKTEIDQQPAATATATPAAEGGENEPAGSNDGTTAAAAATTSKGMPQAGYDKNASFFDRISCETLDRKAGHDTRVDREKQRALDQETFGAAASVSRGRNYRRSYGRGGGNRRGGGGGRGGGGMGGGGFGGGGGYGGRPYMMYNAAPQPMQGRGY